MCFMDGARENNDGGKTKGKMRCIRGKVKDGEYIQEREGKLMCFMDGGRKI